MEPDRGDILLWRRNPVTVWLLGQLAERFRPERGWRVAQGWEETCRLQGQAQVLDFIKDAVGVD